MLNRFDRIINDNKLFCGLDIGDQRVKVGIIEAKNGNLDLLGVYETPVYGFKDGSVTDLGELADCINRAVNSLSSKINVKIKDIYLGIGGDLIDIRPSSATIPLIEKGSKVITEKDVKYVEQQARMLSVKVEEEALHDVAQKYIIDDVNTALNPRGLFGRKLNVLSLVFLMQTNRIRNISKAINQAGFEVGGTYFTSYVSSQVVLTDEFLSDGCVLIDVGSASSTLMIFKDKILSYCEKIPVGGNHFTQSIADRLSLPFDLAEAVKKSYAVAADVDKHKEEEILIKKENDYVPVRREYIFEAIEGPMRKFIGHISSALQTSGLSEQIKKGVVLTGGGALLPGLIERVGHELDQPSRIAQITVIAQKSLTNTATFSSVIGLAYCAYLRYNKKVTPTNPTNWMENLSSKVRELYQEYF